MKLPPFACLFPSAHSHLSMTFMARTAAGGFFLPRHAERAGRDIAVKSDPLSHKRRHCGHLCNQIISNRACFFQIRCNMVLIIQSECFSQRIKLPTPRVLEYTARLHLRTAHRLEKRDSCAARATLGAQRGEPSEHCDTLHVI